ncbi:triosephosphate isomerase [Melioribacter roseus P3M-2]|uniref:Triosephosphate isomerase n=1 Tax=Melioribacter roseus (strain DSM 23840 / JCM 17771 / VKM B-2668 / P3M-2) TaxID=1191523 RepID=I7A5B4_MELRP|nr:triose-phosphate isomerase [Melioribacter roseus]AFN75076.1 triosephosphate isomerase [Melioribacter roseus P3M-2]
MRKKIVAGNWKMNNDLNSSVALISEIKNLLASKSLNAEVIICPPFTSLDAANSLIKDTQIKLGAQNMYYEKSGAFTGEISPLMLKSVGCQYVILGHSERRTIFGESNQLINKKIKAAVENQLNPIFCIGETLEERESGVTFKIIETQMREGLEGLTAEELANLIIAYEPVWAIGTGKTATPEQAEEVHAFIRKLIGELYSTEFAEKLIIQYGGSVKPENAAELMSQPDIDGALVGGACLKADSFVKIIESAQ